MQLRRTLVGVLATIAMITPAGPVTAAPSTPVASASLVCRYDFQIASVWQTGFTGTVEVTNAGTEPFEDWQLEFTLSPSGALVTQAWYGTVLSFHSPVRISGPSWAEDLQPAQAHEVGFSGEFVAASGPVSASNVKLNGTSCSTP